jgi:O-antigen ligase
MSELPVLLGIVGDFFPFGSGFGSFDPVYRYYEPDALLGPAYLNHAHNDFLELVMTGGLPAAAVALVFMVWTVRQALRLRRATETSPRGRYALLAIGMIVLAAFASLVDYPLRTPIHVMLFAFASGWLAALEPHPRSSHAED